MAVTITFDSETFPQLVTDTSEDTVAVGGSTAGTAPETVDTGSAHEVELIPVPPDGTAGGLSPTAVTTRWWSGTRAADEANAGAVAPSDTDPRGAVATGGGTQTEAWSRNGGDWVAATARSERYSVSACSNT